MKPAPFTYVRPAGLDDAIAALAQGGADARLLAGGQSLMPLMNMRLASPSILVDLNGLEELRGIDVSPSGASLGALVRYRDIGRSAPLAEALPLLGAAVSHVAHPVVRNRGTIGGSLAMADPAGEMPAVALALDATVIARSLRGDRAIPVDSFLVDVWQTALEPDEMIVRIDYPRRDEGERFAFREFARRHGDYADAGIVLLRAGAGARAVVFGFGARATRCRRVETWLDAHPEAIRATPEAAALLREDLADRAAECTDGSYRLAITETLFARAVGDLREPS